MNENLKGILKHNNLEMNSKLISKLLWYGPIENCPIQRNDFIFTSIKDTNSCKIIDFYFQIILLLTFNINEINIFNKTNNVNNYINNMNNLENNIYIYDNKKSFTKKFYEYIRNSIAHGSFNTLDKDIIFIGQIKPKIDADINFYFKTHYEYFYENLNKVEKLLNNLINNDLDLKLELIAKLINGIYEKESKIIKSSLGNLTIDDDKNSISSINKFKIIFDKYKSTKKTFVIVENLNIKHNDESNLISEDSNVEIISFDMFIDKFNISIKNIKD